MCKENWYFGSEKNFLRSCEVVISETAGDEARLISESNDTADFAPLSTAQNTD